MKAIPPRPGFDWSRDERAERRLEPFYTHRMRATPGASSTSRVSSCTSIARIDRQYVNVWPREQRSHKSAIMAVAIDIAFEGLTSYRRRAG